MTSKMSSTPNITITQTEFLELRANHWGIPEDPDDETRETVIYLFKRPVEDIGLHIGPVSHWALVFHFGGFDWRTVEGTNTAVTLENGKKTVFLLPQWTPDHPQQEGMIKPVGKVQTSPNELRELVVNNEHNGKDYNMATENCQEWLLSLLTHYGEQIAATVNSDLQAKECFMGALIGVGIGALLGAPAVIAAGAYGIYRYLGHGKS